MTDNRLPQMPAEIAAQLDASLPAVGEAFRAGDIDAAIAGLDAAWALIPEPRFGWDFYPQILAMQMIRNAEAKRDAAMLDVAIDTAHQAYRDPDRVDHYVLSAAGDAWRAVGDADKAGAVYRRMVDIHGKQHLSAEQKAFLENRVATSPAPPSATNSPTVPGVTSVEAAVEIGNEAYDEDRYADAIAAWDAGFALLAEPRHEQDEAMWLKASIGEAYSFLDDWAAALHNFEIAHRCDGGHINPLVLFGIGEASFHLGDMDRAKDYFTQAYMVDGEDIFEDADPAYLAMVTR